MDRLGFAGQSRPIVVLDSAKVIDTVVTKNRAIFGESLSSGNERPLSLFSENGSFGDWRLILAVVQFLYGEAGEDVLPQSQPVLVCWPSLAPPNAMKMASLLLRKLNVPALYFAPAPLLAIRIRKE